MKTKTETVRELVLEGKLEKALKIAKDFKKTYNITMEELSTLKLGWECLKRPDIYIQLNKDVDLEVKKALEILVRIYGGK